jgi:outer membrane murein-binding lipoprotein Lpp
MAVDSSLQQQIDDLVAQVATNGARIDQLRREADAAHVRADAAEERADSAERRVDHLHAESIIDREMIATLQADGILSRDHVAQLEEALISSRSIGAAIGILMASRQVSQDQAFLVLKEASQRSNRKLHDLAAELVASTTTPAG